MAEAFTAEEIAALPSRIYTSEVCRLARYGPGKLLRERAAGRMPDPIDRGHEAIFDRDAVLKALGMVKDAGPHENADSWDVDPDAIRDARPRKIRHDAPTQGRDVPRAVRGPRKAPALRLVGGDPTTARSAAKW